MARMDEELLSMKEAATRKGVPVGDVERAIESGELSAEDRGGAYFVDPDELDLWVPHVKSAVGADMDMDDANEYLRTPDTPS